MGFVKLQRCAARALGRCDSSSFVEADHAGSRGLGVKADDTTCIPLCSKHHRERTEFAGDFACFNKNMMRTWLAAVVDSTRAMFEAYLAERKSPLY
jgi:hypothetical protein